MKKFLYIVLSCFVVLWSGLKAGIIGAARWIKDGKTICVYYDYHELGTMKENQVHFACIQDKLRQHAGPQPLTVLVENGCTGDFARFTREIDRKLLATRFLEMFDGIWEAPPLPNVIFRSIDARNIVFLIDTWVGEWCHVERAFGVDFLMQLREALQPYPFGRIRAEALEKIRHCVDRTQGAPWKNFVEQQQKELEENLSAFQENFCRQCEIAPTVFERAPMVDLFFDHRDRGRMARLEFIGRGDGFFSQEMLAPLVNATLACEALSAPGDVVVFAGGLHGLILGELLEELGYASEGVPLRRLKRLFKTGDEAAFRIVPTVVYDWIR